MLHYILSLLLLTLLVVPSNLGSSDQADAEITVTGADNIRSASTTASSELNSLLASVSDRFIVENGDTVRYPDTGAPSSALNSLLKSVHARVIFDSADKIRHTTMSGPNATLGGLLKTVADRMIFESADVNRASNLVYPRELLNDTKPPSVSQLTVESLTGKAKVKWSTNEFAACEVKYFQGNKLLGTLGDPLFHKTHEQVLKNLSDGVEYRAEVQCTDLSGNVSARRSVSFELQASIPSYLPFVSR